MDSFALFADAILVAVKSALGDDYVKKTLSKETTKALNSLGLYHQIMQRPQKVAKDLINNFKL